MSAVHAQSNLTVAQDVRRLIGQVEKGHAFDFEMTGHAYDVMGAASEAVSARVHSTTLAQDIERRVEQFAQSKGSVQMYLRLVITDIAPDLPEYDPSEVVIFDGVTGGTNFSTANMRFTNAGTVVTSVNVTDLKAYFEAGRKRILVAYMGTDRNADAKANDKLLSLLPDMLASMGMDASTIKQVIEAVKAGNVPAPISKLLHQIVQLAELKTALHAQPGSKEILARIAVIEKETVTLMAHVQSMPTLPAVFAKAFENIKPANIAMAVALPTSRIAAVSNDNKSSLRAVRDLIQELRQTAKDKTLPPEQRREIAAILRDLRAGIRSNNPAPLRLGDGLLKLSALTASIMAQPNRPAVFDRILPRAISATLLLASSPFMAALKPVFASVLRDIPASPQMKDLIARASENGKAAEMLARFIARYTESVQSISPTPLAQALQSAKNTDFVPAIKKPALSVALRSSLSTPAPKPASEATSRIADIKASAVATSPRMTAPAPVQHIATPSRPQPAPAETARPVQETKAVISTVVQAPAKAVVSKLPDTALKQPAPTPNQEPSIAPVDQKKTDIKAPEKTPDLAPRPGGSEKPAEPAAKTPQADGKQGSEPDTKVVTTGAAPEAKPSVEPQRPDNNAPAQANDPVQLNPDGSIKACCLPQFTEAVKAGTSANAPVIDPPKTLQHVEADGTVRAITKQDIAQNMADHESIRVGPMRGINGNTVVTGDTTQKKWTNDTLNLLNADTTKDDHMYKLFNHKCGAGCNHGDAPKTAEPSTGHAVQNRDVEVRFVAVEPTPDKKPSKRPQRTMKPA